MDVAFELAENITVLQFGGLVVSGNKEDINFFTSIADICAGTIERINYSKQILNYQRDLEQQVEIQTRKLSQEKERLAEEGQVLLAGVVPARV